MQLLYVANRHEKKPDIERALGAGTTIICDRYIASSVAYGEAHGLDPRWLTEIQRFLPAPDLSILLDIAPETAAQRKAAGRDKLRARSRALVSRARRATIVKLRPRRAGCASTANALATPSGRMCSRQSRHDSRRGEGADVPGPGPSQRDGARVQRGAGGRHIVHEQHCQPIDRVTSLEREGIPDVRVPPARPADRSAMMLPASGAARSSIRDPGASPVLRPG